MAHLANRARHSCLVLGRGMSRVRVKRPGAREAVDVWQMSAAGRETGGGRLLGPHRAQAAGGRMQSCLSRQCEGPPPTAALGGGVSRGRADQCMYAGGWRGGRGGPAGRRPGGRTGEVHGCFSPVASEGHVCHGSREDNELPVRTPVSVVSAHRGARTHHKYFLAP